MKRIVMLVLIVSVFASVFPIAMNFALLKKPAEDIKAESESEAHKPGADSEMAIKVSTGGETGEYTMAEYLPGLLAAEMPASFEPEALKAQAVAARTYIMYRSASTIPSHPEASICDDPACCAAHISDEKMREKWGADYDEYYEKVCSAVSETDGEYLTYEGEPIQAVFHSSSAGATENSSNIWSPLPYLVSVSSPETEADVPNFSSKVEVAEENFRSTILASYPEAELSGEAGQWIGECRYDDTGRVESITVGGAAIKGTDMRALFSLRSAVFTLGLENENFVFWVTGYGHGVGMSQYGANVMAGEGCAYTEILQHYYVGAGISKAKQEMF